MNNVRPSKRRASVAIAMLAAWVAAFSSSIPVLAAAPGDKPCVVEPTVLDTPNPAQFHQVHLNDVRVVAPDDIWAVGLWRQLIPPFTIHEFTLTMRYDGEAWSIVPSPTPGGAGGSPDAALSSVDFVSPDEVYAAGKYVKSGVWADTLVLRWDGEQWEHLISPGQSVFGSQGHQFEVVRVMDAQNIWFGGSTAGASAPVRAYMVHYDGSDFTEYELPITSNGAHRIRAIGWSGLDDVWAVGATGGSAVAVGASYVARFNGETWTHLPTPHPGTAEILRAVAVLADDDVWVSGSYNFITNDFQVVATPLFLHWNGSEWTQHASPGYANALHAFAPDDIYGVSHDTLIHYDGESWRIVEQLDTNGISNLMGLDAIDECALIGVGWQGLPQSSLAATFTGALTPSIPGDLNGDGIVGVADLLILLANWGACPDCNNCPADLDGDCSVGVADLLMLLANWG